MSADNYILIRKERIGWVGYMQSASVENIVYDNPCFTLHSFMGAIAKSQELSPEHGYWVQDIEAILASKNWLGL